MEQLGTVGSPSLTLFVRAGRDGHSLGACPDSQRVLLLAQLKGVPFRAVAVCPSRPPAEFSELGTPLRLPAACAEGGAVIVDGVDEVVALLERLCPGGLYQPDNTELEVAAERATRDVFSRFCYLVRGVARDTSQLEAELRRTDVHLAKLQNAGGGPFLLGPTLSALDVEVLPKIHQARVAAHAIMGYEIPLELSALWCWLHAAYSLRAFSATCPCDAEIALHWLDAVGAAVGSPERRRQMKALYEGSPRFSLTVPVRAEPVLIE